MLSGFGDLSAGTRRQRRYSWLPWKEQNSDQQFLRAPRKLNWPTWHIFDRGAHLPVEISRKTSGTRVLHEQQCSKTPRSLLLSL